MTDAFMKGYRTVENLEFCAECYAAAGFVPFSTPEGLSGWNPSALSPSDFVASVMAEYGVDGNAVYRWSVANALATSASVDA